MVERPAVNRLVVGSSPTCRVVRESRRTLNTAYVPAVGESGLTQPDSLEPISTPAAASPAWATATPARLSASPTLPATATRRNGSIAKWIIDNTTGPPRGPDRDAHLVVGNPQFVDAAAGNYALTPHSPAIGKVPAARIDDLTHDCVDNPRPVNGAYDVGAFQTQSSR